MHLRLVENLDSPEPEKTPGRPGKRLHPIIVRRQEAAEAIAEGLKTKPIEELMTDPEMQNKVTAINNPDENPLRSVE